MAPDGDERRIASGWGDGRGEMRAGRESLRVPRGIRAPQGQVIDPSTVEAAPAPTCTWQLVIELEIELLFAATV